jgi:hypothetical protein
MKITEYKSLDIQGNELTNVCIDDENGNFQWMLKSTYEAQQAEQSTPNLPA